MRIVWDERKRLANLAKHELDFADLSPDSSPTAAITPAMAERTTSQMTREWPSFGTADLGDSDEDDIEMQRRWDVYDREMQALIAAGGVHRDADGWWVDDATGELIGPDPSIEKPATDEELATARPFAEVLPELHASIQRARGRPVTGKARQVVSLRLDPEVVAKFKATGPGWQSRINDVLKKAKVG